MYVRDIYLRCDGEGLTAEEFITRPSSISWVKTSSNLLATRSRYHAFRQIIAQRLRVSDDEVDLFSVVNHPTQPRTVECLVVGHCTMSTLVSISVYSLCPLLCPFICPLVSPSLCPSLCPLVCPLSRGQLIFTTLSSPKLVSECSSSQPNSTALYSLTVTR